MIDIYLKAATQADIHGCMEDAGLMVDDALAYGVCLDEIGEIEGATGYHANLRALFDLTDEQMDALEPIEIVAPETPVRVWA